MDDKIVDAAAADAEKEGGEEKVGQKVEEAEVKAEAEAGQEVEEKVEEIDLSQIEPEVRKRPIDYIEERKASRAERESEASAQEGEEISPEVKSALRKEVEEVLGERMKPFAETLAKSANEREISDFLSKTGREHYRKYESLAKRYMDTKAYSEIPAENIFLMLDAKYGNPVERGAKEQKERAAKGGRTRTSGSSSRPAPIPDDLELASRIKEMTPEEFDAFDKKIKAKK